MEQNEIFEGEFPAPKATSEEDAAFGNCFYFAPSSRELQKIETNQRKLNKKTG